MSNRKRGTPGVSEHSFATPFAHTMRRPVVHLLDRDGTPIVRVPLPCGDVATLCADDFDALTAAGVSPNWTLNANGQRSAAYVRVAMPGKRGSLVTVARLIAGAAPGAEVSYRDRNPLNLRRGNLIVSGGKVETAPGNSRE
jgi:hypothetical protein